MIFVTGDCHMEYQKFNMANFPEQKNLTREDYMRRFWFMGRF